MPVCARIESHAAVARERAWSSGCSDASEKTLNLPESYLRQIWSEGTLALTSPAGPVSPGSLRKGDLQQKHRWCVACAEDPQARVELLLSCKHFICAKGSPLPAWELSLDQAQSSTCFG